MLDGYREQLDDEDAALLDDIKGELSESLERVGVNGNRALTIVRRMQSLGVVGGEPSLTVVHPVLRRSVQLGCDTFAAEWGDFTVEPEYRFSDDVSEAAMVASDFNEAVVNLVTNACYAMRAPPRVRALRSATCRPWWWAPSCGVVRWRSASATTAPALRRMCCPASLIRSSPPGTVPWALGWGCRWRPMWRVAGAAT